MYNGYGFGSLANQNNVNTNYSSQVPTMPGYAGVDKLKFADMRSPQDQIHWLYLYALQLSQDFITREEAQALVDAAAEALKAYSDAQDAKQDEAFAQDQARQDADVLKRYYYLLDLINETGKFNGSCFDPTIGHERNIKKVLERVYDFDRLFALTAGDWDGDYKLTAAAFDAQGTKARDYDVDYALVHYNDSRKTMTDTPQSTYFVRMLKRMVGGGEGSILTFNAPLKQDGENITLDVDDSLKVESDVLGVNAEKPISTEGGAVSLAHDATLKVADGQLGVAPATETTLGAVRVGDGLLVETEGEDAGYLALALAGGLTRGGVILDDSETIPQGQPYAPVKLTSANLSIGIGLGTGLVQDSDRYAALRQATKTTLGGVKIGEGIDVAADGTISASSGSEINVIAPLVAEDAAQELSNDGYSLAIGMGAVAGTEDGNNAVAIGTYADAAGGQALAVGNYCSAPGTGGGVAIGNGAAAGKAGARNTCIAIGDAVSATGQTSIAIGFWTTISAADAVMIGKSSVKSDGSIAIGSNAGVAASAEGSIAIGQNAAVSENCAHSVAIGNNSQAATPYEFSIGNAATTRRITHVTAPADATDATNKGYVDTVIREAGAVSVMPIESMYLNETVSGLDTANSHIALFLDGSGTYHPVSGSLSFTVPSGGITGFQTGIPLETYSLSTRDIYALAFVPSEASYDTGGSVVRHRFRLGLHDGCIAIEAVDSPFTAVSEMPITITF